MKTISLLSLLFFFNAVTFAQNYELKYKETMNWSQFPALKVDPSKVKNESGIPVDSSFVQMLMNKMVKEKMSAFNFIATVKVKNGRSYVHLANDGETEGIKMNLKDADQIIYKGKMVNNYEPDTAKTVQIVPTGKTKLMKGYSCEQYVSKDNTHDIWFCKTLPNSINPGLLNLSEYPGAVMAFVLKGDFGVQTMEVESIAKVR